MPEGEGGLVVLQPVGEVHHAAPGQLTDQAASSRDDAIQRSGKN